MTVDDEQTSIEDAPKGQEDIIVTLVDPPAGKEDTLLTAVRVMLRLFLHIG